MLLLLLHHSFILSFNVFLVVIRLPPVCTLYRLHVRCLVLSVDDWWEENFKISCILSSFWLWMMRIDTNKTEKFTTIFKNPNSKSWVASIFVQTVSEHDLPIQIRNAIKIEFEVWSFGTMNCINTNIWMECVQRSAFNVRTYFSFEFSSIVWFTIYNSHLIHMQWLSLFFTSFITKSKKNYSTPSDQIPWQTFFFAPLFHHLISCAWFKFPIHWRAIVSFSVCIPRRSVATTNFINENY